MKIFLSEDAEAVGIEVRPRSRPFKSSSFRVPPAKWTVAVLSLKPETFTVYILFMDRKIQEGREFGWEQEQGQKYLLLGDISSLKYIQLKFE